MFSCVLENTMENQWPLMTSDGKDWMQPMVVETGGRDQWWQWPAIGRGQQLETWDISGKWWSSG